jgi:hypothetical protein
MYDLLYKNGLSMAKVRVIRGRSMSLVLSEALRVTSIVFQSEEWVSRQRDASFIATKTIGEPSQGTADVE